MSRRFARFAALALLVPAAAQAQAPKVGPARGTVIVVGGGSMGPEIYGDSSRPPADPTH